MLDAPVARVRHALGNCARFVTSPWREQGVEPDMATTIFGCGFGESGWHHLRRTLQEIDRDPHVAPQATSLWRFLKHFTPGSISDLAGVRGEEPLPLFVYPWGAFNTAAGAAAKNPWTSRFCGPSTDEFIAEEFHRTVQLYQALRETGYRPYRYPNSFIGGTWLMANDGRRRFVVMQGNHRMAALAHLGAQVVAVRSIHQALPAVHESDLPRWPLVASGRCSPTHAREVFEFFFRHNGWHVAGLLPPAPPSSPD
jgi:hypothetical protein